MTTTETTQSAARILFWTAAVSFVLAVLGGIAAIWTSGDISTRLASTACLLVALAFGSVVTGSVLS
jgi:cytochrome b subunit of formate dehydrogenase